MVNAKTILETLGRWPAYIRRDGLARGLASDEPPLRSELFSADQMEQHGKALAASHKLGPGHAPDLLLARLATNEDVLNGVRDVLTEAVKADRRDHAGRRMAAGQLLSDRGADPHGQTAFAERL